MFKADKLQKKLVLLMPVLFASVGWVGCDLAGSGNRSNEFYATVEVTTSNFEDVVLNNDKPVLLDFWASWCGPCQKLSPTIEQLAAEYDGQVVIGKVNVEEQKAIAAKYEIDAIPTLLYFRDGEVVKRTFGKSKAAIIADIEEVSDR